MTCWSRLAVSLMTALWREALTWRLQPYCGVYCCQPLPALDLCHRRVQHCRHAQEPHNRYSLAGVHARDRRFNAAEPIEGLGFRQVTANSHACGPGERPEVFAAAQLVRRHRLLVLLLAARLAHDGGIRLTWNRRTLLSARPLKRQTSSFIAVSQFNWVSVDANAKSEMAICGTSHRTSLAVCAETLT